MILTLELANNQLNKVRIRQKGNKLYLRATLPPKPGDGFLDKQYELSTGMMATPDGIKNVLVLAKRLESEIEAIQLVRKISPDSIDFDWTKWDKKIKDNNQLTIEIWLIKYEEFYWQTHQKTANTQETFKNYQRVYNRLPKNEFLTQEILFSVLAEFPPNSRSRELAYTCYKSLAQFAELPLSDRFKYLKGNYKPPKTAYIPTDEEIIRYRDNIKREDYRWAYEVMAVYGVRPSEVFHLDLSLYPILKVLEDTKTGERLAYAIPENWLEVFDIEKNLVPRIPREGKSNKELSSQLAKGFRRCNLPFTARALRHAYSIRGAAEGFDSVMVARWMGHSTEEHSETYLRYIEKLAMDRYYKKMARTGKKEIDDLRLISPSLW